MSLLREGKRDLSDIVRLEGGNRMMGGETSGM